MPSTKASSLFTVTDISGLAYSSATTLVIIFVVLAIPSLSSALREYKTHLVSAVIKTAAYALMFGSYDANAKTPEYGKITHTKTNKTIAFFSKLTTCPKKIYAGG